MAGFNLIPAVMFSAASGVFEQLGAFKASDILSVLCFVRCSASQACGIAFIRAYRLDVAAVMTRELYRTARSRRRARSRSVSVRRLCASTTPSPAARRSWRFPVALGPCIVIMFVCKRSAEHRPSILRKAGKA
ncbi:MAG: hypothetical protein ACLT4C_10115 [Butyricicoccus sp.]